MDGASENQGTLAISLAPVLPVLIKLRMEILKTWNSGLDILCNWYNFLPFVEYSVLFHMLTTRFAIVELVFVHGWNDAFRIRPGADAAMRNRQPCNSRLRKTTRRSGINSVPCLSRTLIWHCCLPMYLVKVMLTSWLLQHLQNAFDRCQHASPAYGVLVLQPRICKSSTVHSSDHDFNVPSTERQCLWSNCSRLPFGFRLYTAFWADHTVDCSCCIAFALDPSKTRSAPQGNPKDTFNAHSHSLPLFQSGQYQYERNLFFNVLTYVFCVGERFTISWCSTGLADSMGSATTHASNSTIFNFVLTGCFGHTFSFGTWALASSPAFVPGHRLSACIVIVWCGSSPNTISQTRDGDNTGPFHNQHCHQGTFTPSRE